MVSVTSLPHSENGECAAAPLLISWRDLSLYSKKGKALLGKASGSLSTGFHAIMGPSGAGKSTLLNALAYRLDKGVRKEGSLSLNGQPYSISEVKKVGGYVMQDDLLNGHLTVEETLAYAARLRLPPSFSEEERRQRVEEVIVACNLAGCITTIVGNPLKKGISGGERKRLCVALELLTRPQLLFLDEPTTGLDSVTALSLSTSLRNLAHERRCTILCTLHQPSAKIFSLFDTLTLVQGGRQVYQGPPADAVIYFEEQGFPCPPLTNPADHVMDIITPVRSTSGRLTKVLTLSGMMDKQESIPENDEMQEEGELTLREDTSWMKQYRILLERCVKAQRRKWKTFVIQVVQSIIMAVLIGGATFQIGTGQSSRRRRLGVIYFCAITQGIFGATAVVNSFDSERVITLRERAAGMYYASAYFLAKVTIETSVSVITPIIFSSIAYWMIGLQPIASKFLIYMTFMVLCNLAATSLALAISALCRDMDLAVVILPMALEVSRLFGGYITPPSLSKAWAVWLEAISYLRYSYIGLALNELTGLKLTCTPKEVEENHCVRYGEEFILALGLDYISIGAAAGILVSYIVFCYFLAYLGLRFRK